MEFLNAYTYGFCEKRGFTGGTAWKHSLRLLQQSTGCNAIILPICAWQDHTYSTTMDSDHPDVMSPEDVHNVCAEARSLGMKVILKAMVNCRDGYWRAYIRFFDTEVAAYVYRENVLLTVFGILAGILFGTVLHHYTITTVEVDLMMFGRTIRPVSYLYSTLITFGFALLVNGAMYFTLKKVDMIESLKSVE